MCAGMRHTHTLLLMGALMSWSCGLQDASTVELGDDEATADGPLLGANGQDAADRACNVVLRTATRTELNGSFVTRCTTAGCFVVWTGTLDVSAQAVAEGAKAYVLFKNQDTAVWTRASTSKVSGAPAGFQRYAYRLEKNTISPSISFTSLSNAKVMVAPYLLTRSGARLFDHNRVPGDFDSYELKQSNGFAVADDLQVCQPLPTARPTLDFQLGWRTVQRGALVAGRPAVITYAIDRLPDCRGTHNGYPAWDVVASVRFSPGGQVVEGTVRGFDSLNGTPTNAGAKGVPFGFDVPAGATSAQVWFHNFTGAGSNCSAWDSNQGANYQFAVEPHGFAAVQWVGNPGSSFSRACSRQEGAPATVVLDSYLQQRACSFVEADVYVPGLTDGASLKSEAVWADVELKLDGQPMTANALPAFVGRAGNDYRFHYELPRSDLFYGPKWQTLSYTLRFSTDGDTWVRDTTRTLTRDVSFCNPAWASCS
jgi:hypothetical protein